MPNEEPLISICIPCFNSEKTLRRALDSVASQSFSGWEIILVNDGSHGRDEKNHSAHKILKIFQKQNKIPRGKINYIEHSTNLGLLEARRTAVNAANGKYIVVLDSDDELLHDALKILYETAVQTEADIVCGKEIRIFPAVNEPVEAKKHEATTENENTTLTGHQILDGFLIHHNHRGFLWGKIFRKSVYQKALEQIPFTKCTMAEDFLQYFYISYFSQKMLLIDKPVYKYYIVSGISTGKTIESLEKWEQICTTANVFTTIFSTLHDGEIALSEEETDALRLQSRSYLKNTLLVLENKVLPQLKKDARSLLCDYWGEDFVQLMENAVEV